MLLNDRKLLRLHIEAVWDIHLPPITQNSVDVLANSNQPPWLLYVAQMANERIYIWHSNTDNTLRQTLQKRMEDVLTQPVETSIHGIGREIAFSFTGEARMTFAQAQQLARPITPHEQTLVEAWQAGAAQYFFTPERGPLFGTIRDGRLLSIAHSARRTTEACELGIETQPEARHRGYALAATILWTHEILREGLVPIYSALAENSASRALAEAAGYRVFARGINIANLP